MSIIITQGVNLDQKLPSKTIKLDESLVSQKSQENSKDKSKIDYT